MKYKANTVYWMDYTPNFYIILNERESDDLIRGVPKTTKNGYPGSCQNCSAFKEFREATEAEIAWYNSKDKVPFSQFKYNAYEIY